MEQAEQTQNAAELPAWDQHLLALHAHFAQHADQRCLLWINPAQNDPFEGDELIEQHRFRVPIAHPRFDIRYAPYLVELDLSRSRDGDVLSRSVKLAANAWHLDSLQQMNGQPVCGWVDAACPVDALGRYWASSCHVHYRNSQAQLLRFHDCGVREWLWPPLDSHQRATLLGPARKIFSISRNGALLAQAVEQQPAPEVSTLLRLTARQWDDLEDYAIVHAALLVLCTQDASWNSRLWQQPGWQQQVLDALRHATGYGIIDQRDRTLFARHALEIGPDFHFNAALQPVWEQTRAGEWYGGALEDATQDSAERLCFYLHDKV